MTRGNHRLGAVLAAAALLIVAACSPDAGTQSQTAAAPEALAAASPEALAAALASEARPDSDRERDAGRKPDQILEFMGVGPGMTVLDVGSSSGYYAEILSHAVGGEGRVIAQNSFGLLNFLKRDDYRAGLLARYGDGHLANVTLAYSNVGKLGQAEGSVDAALIGLIYHHMHYKKDDGEAMPSGTRAALEAIAHMLKPGGVVVVIEHRAPDDDTRAASAERHKVPAAIVKADFESVGLKLDGELDIFANPDDPRQLPFFKTPELKGKTDRLVMRFRKPS